MEILDQLGEMPLPPYIKEQLEDQDRYQTVYAKKLGQQQHQLQGFILLRIYWNKLSKKEFTSLMLRCMSV